MKMFKTGSKIRNLIGLAVLATVGATTTVALAADSGLLTVNAVEYGNNSLLIQLSNGVNYIGSTSAPAGCTSGNVDTLKIWVSQAQSALLAGKRLKIYYATCSGTPYISGVDIWN